MRIYTCTHTQAHSRMRHTHTHARTNTCTQRDGEIRDKHRFKELIKMCVKAKICVSGFSVENIGRPLVGCINLI